MGMISLHLRPMGEVSSNSRTANTLCSKRLNLISVPESLRTLMELNPSEYWIPKIHTAFNRLNT